MRPWWSDSTSFNSSSLRLSSSSFLFYSSSSFFFSFSFRRRSRSIRAALGLYCFLNCLTAPNTGLISLVISLLSWLLGDDDALDSCFRSPPSVLVKTLAPGVTNELSLLFVISFTYNYIVDRFGSTDYGRLLSAIN